MLRLRLTAWLDLDDVTIVGHVTVIDVDDRSTSSLSLPWTELDLG